MRMSWTEIAVDMAKLIAKQHGCELQSFSLDGVEIDTEEGVEVVHMQATASMSPALDEIPFEVRGAVESA